MSITFLQTEEQNKNAAKNQPVSGIALTLAEEQELLSRAKIDEQAFSKLYETYFSRIYAYIFKRVGHKETVEDLVAEIFTKAFVNIDKFQYRGYSFGAWLYQLATNHLIDFYRKKGKLNEIELEEKLAQSNGDNSLTEQIDQKQTDLLVRKTIMNLPKKYQKVLMLKFFAQLSNQEIARVTNLTANNIGVILYRALKRFKKEFIQYV